MTEALFALKISFCEKNKTKKKKKIEEHIFLAISRTKVPENFFG
jgi:hypothetical protein